MVLPLKLSFLLVCLQFFEQGEFYGRYDADLPCGGAPVGQAYVTDHIKDALDVGVIGGSGGHILLELGERAPGESKQALMILCLAAFLVSSGSSLLMAC